MGSKPPAALPEKQRPPVEETTKGSAGFRDYVRIFSFGQPSDYLLVAAGLLAAIGSGVALSLVNVVIGDFITIMTAFSSTGTAPENFMSEVSKYALYFVYIGIARLAFTYLYSALLTLAALRITRNIRHAYLRSALSQEVGFYDFGSAGSVSMQATSNGKLIQSGTSEKLGQVFQAIATFISAFVIAFVSQWKLTLILISMVPALLIIVSVAGAFDARIETKNLQLYAQAGAFAEVVLSSVRTTRAFNLGPRMAARYSQFLDRVQEASKWRHFIYAVMFGGEYFVVFSGMALAFWQGISMITRREVDSVGTVFIVLFSVVIAAAMINSLAPHMVVFSRAATAAAELFRLVDRQSAINSFDGSGDIPNSVLGTIDIQGVSFCYPTRPSTTVLANFSLHIPAGKVTALVGASGSGKSTVIGLLERWYNPGSGRIQIDGRNIDRLNLHWLRTNVRLVQQEPVLFNGTVYDNICDGLNGTAWESESRGQKMQRVQAAAKMAFAHDFIMGLPQGYDTRVGERGGLLSGGQKQRIAIARSIVSEPKVLLLDEATSALDPQAEGIVQKALDEASKNRTTIVIAHKLKTVQSADNIVVMSRGSIVEQGRHDDLVARGGAYAALVRAQDLSAAAKDVSARASEGFDADDDEKDEEPDAAAVQKTESLARQRTHGLEQSTALANREDYALASRAAMLRSILSLAKSTPELKLWYAITLIACSLGAALYPGQALLLGNITDVFTAPDAQKRGNFLALMFFVAALGCVVVFGTLGWSTSVIAQTVSRKVRQGMFDATLRQDLRFFDRPENTVGSMTSRIDTTSQSIFELAGFNVAIMLISVISIVVSTALSIGYSWKLGLVGALAGLPPIVGAGYIRVRVETRMDAMLDGKFSKSASLASETLAAIRTVSSLAIESSILDKYTAELDAATKASTGPLFHMMIWFSLTQSVEFFILALGFWWGSKLLVQGSITFYQFFVSFMAVYFTGQGAGLLFSFTTSFTKANSAANYFFWLQNLHPLIRETNENRDKGPARDYSSYDLKDLQFEYPLAPNNLVLRGVSIKIQPSQFVAFVGASGCGKSTMISLLERYYDPTKGRIVIDDSDSLADLNPRLYRRDVSLVQQEPTLFPGSIRDNVAMGIDDEIDVNDEIIEAACRAANAWDFICSLPEGLNTPCGAGGSQLSGGQRQRIAIARALARNPQVILLDEATSALDTESERIVQAALMEAASSKSRITIAVAHRLSTVRDADCIFVFSGGRIAEMGSHDELLARGGMYAKMCEAQSLDA